jgi:hypothetical protein
MVFEEAARAGSGGLLGIGGRRDCERLLKRCAAVNRLSVRSQNPLEWELEQGAHRRQRSLRVPRHVPNPQALRGAPHVIGEYQGAVFRQPQRRFAAITAVMNRDRLLASTDDHRPSHNG